MIACLTWLAGGCASNEVELPSVSSKDDPVSMVIVSDPHYLSANLTDGGPMFRRAIRIFLSIILFSLMVTG